MKKFIFVMMVALASMAIPLLPARVMATSISAFTELTSTPASDDLLVIVDVSDTTMATTGTTKKITFGNFSSDFYIVLDLGDDGSNESSGISEIATSGDTNSIFTEPTADKLLIDVSQNWPSADTATALAANGANCSAGSYPLGVDEYGAVESCTADDDVPEAGDFTNLTGGDGIDHSVTGTIAVDLLTSGADGDSTTTSTDSGLEIVSNKLSLIRGCADDQILKWDETNDLWECATDDTGSGGSAIVLDLADDGSNESSDLSEIATTGDTHSIFTEPSADKLLIDVSKNWPTADTAATATALASNGSNCSAGYYPLGVDASGNVESCTADQDTQLSQEQVEDYVGGMTSGAETLISVTYDDAGGNLDYVVDSDLHNYSWTNVVDSDVPDAITVSTSGEVQLPEIGTATYDDLQDWFKTIQSAGKISGGAIADNGDGSISVAAGTGWIKSADSDTAAIYFFDWSADSSVSLTDNSPNYIYIDYNGGSPQVGVSTSMPTDHNTKILLGEVYREGTDLHKVSAGQIASNLAKRVFWKDIEINGKFQRSSGIIISETGTRNFAVTAGTVYSGWTKTSMSAFDSSASDTFTYYYRDGSGGWTKVTGQTQIDNTHYDDGSGTLATLSSGGWIGADHYGVHWVYEDIDSDMFVVYGQGDYTLAEAQDAQPPSAIPDILDEVGGLIGKIIIQKNDSSFTSCQSAFDVTFSPSAVQAHNDLSDIQGGTSDEYYHLTETQHTTLTGWASDGVDKLQNGTNPTTTAAGDVGIDTDATAYGALKMYGATGAALLPALHTAQATIWDIATIQETEDAIPLMRVESSWAPAGITIVDIYLAADASNSESYTLEEWTDPTTYGSDIETVAFSSSTEAEDDGTLSDASVAAGSYVFIDLPASSALNFLQVTFTYVINP